MSSFSTVTPSLGRSVPASAVTALIIAVLAILELAVFIVWQRRRHLKRTAEVESRGVHRSRGGGVQPARPASVFLRDVGGRGVLAGNVPGRDIGGEKGWNGVIATTGEKPSPWAPKTSSSTGDAGGKEGSGGERGCGGGGDGCHCDGGGSGESYVGEGTKEMDWGKF